MENRQPNSLIHADSPYLLQHAYNPVNWFEWSDEAWELAKKQNKMVLVSIGYAACHWCHVMERETFENEQAAALMNEKLICIKVDREERPDVDQLYMDAVQLMTGRGGWPLNVFCIPDRRPVYGGTYYPLANWMDVIPKLTELWETSPEKTLEYAEKLTEGIRNSDLTAAASVEGISRTQLRTAANTFLAHIDQEHGGINTVPKFPLPGNWKFLLHYFEVTRDENALHGALFTLMKMGYGGICDQAGGGFARYATDGKWLVPHFEKMLYDNAQLISVYAKAYRLTGNHFYKTIIDETTEFLKSELSNRKGGYFSSLDADSEGEEGKFYVWSLNEVQKLLGEESELFCEIYNITDEGNWEEGKNILHITYPLEEIAEEKHMLYQELKSKLERGKELLMKARSQRIRPALDDKIVCSWQALQVKAYCDTWLSSGEKKYYDLALESGAFLRDRFLDESGILYRIVKNEKHSIPAFMEDYACVIEALIQLYQVNFDEEHLLLAKKLTDYTLENFFSAENSLFYFTSTGNNELIARKTDTGDDVIPASNSVMCQNLIKLSAYFGNPKYREIAEKMVMKTGQQVLRHPTAYSNWLSAALMLAYGLKQVVISGQNSAHVIENRDHGWHKLLLHLGENVIVAMSGANESSLPIFKDRLSGHLQFCVCHDTTCHLPVNTMEEALALLRKE